MSNMTHWSNTDLGNCIGFNGDDNSWNDDCGDYFRHAVSKIAALGVFCAAFTLLFVVFYLFARLCGCLRCTFGGCRITATGATRQAVQTYRSCVLIGGLSLLICAAFASHYRHDLRHSVDNVNDVVDTVRAQCTNGVDSIANRTRSVSQNSPIDNSTVAAVEKAVKDVNDWSHDLKDAEDDWSNSLWVIDFLVWTATGFFLVFTLTALLNVHIVVPVCFFVLFVLLAFSGAIMQGFLGVWSQMVTDVCDDYPAFNSSMTSFFDSEKFRTEHVVTTLESLSSGLTTQYTDYQCALSSNSSSILAALCGASFSCGSQADCAATLPTSIEFLSNSSMNDNSSACIGCSIVDCAAQCSAGQAKTLSQEMMTKWAIVSMDLKVIAEEAPRLYTGEVFEAGIINVQPSVCVGDNSMEHHLKPTTRGVSGAAFFLVVCMVLTALGSYIFYGSIAEDEGLPLVYMAGPGQYGAQQPPTVGVVGYQSAGPNVNNEVSKQDMLQ